MTVKVDVQESGDKVALMNEGGGDLMKSLKGEKAGLPFYAFVNPNGKMIVNAMQMKKGETMGNIGHPMSAEEVTNFMKIVMKAAPKMTKAEFGVLDAWLRNQQN